MTFYSKCQKHATLIPCPILTPRNKGAVMKKYDSGNEFLWLMLFAYFLFWLMQWAG